MYNLLEQLAATSSRNEKEKLLRAFPDPERLKRLFKYTMNPYWQYGVHVDQEGFGEKSYKEDEMLLEDSFFFLLDEFKERKITGNSAKNEARELFKEMYPLQAKWLVKVLNRNFKNGVQGTTVNKIWPGLIPGFALQLCSKYQGGDPDKEMMIEPKLDGIRVVLIIDEDGEMKMLSRNGKPVNNWGHIKDEVTVMGLKGWVIDAELMADDWNLSAGLARRHGERDERLKLYAFDNMAYNEFQCQVCEASLGSRRIILEKMVKGFNTILVTDMYMVHTEEQIMESAQKFMEDGYEGAVIKDPDSLYTFNRSKAWQKVKFEDTYDLEIIGFQEGTGRHEGRLGAFICQIKDMGRPAGTVNVGGGLSDQQRTEFWARKDELSGAYVEVKAQKQLKGYTSESLRFPVFVRLREDK